MIKIDDIDVYGIKNALVGARFPLATDIEKVKELPIEKLLDLGNRLGKTGIGEGHDKFLRQISLSFTLTAPRYFWQEFATYHFTTMNSQSTMHRLSKFNIRDMVEPEVDSAILDRVEQLQKE